MKVVVTGGSGQLGTLVLERLAAEPAVTDIVSLDVVPPRVPSGASGSRARMEWRIADLRDPGLERHLEGAQALVHMAFLVARRASRKTMEEVNVQGSKALFEAAARHGVERIVYSSSVAAYGMVPGHPNPLTEASPRRRSGTFSYADNKYDVEAHLDDFEKEHPEIAVTRLRPGVLLGRRVTHISEAVIQRRWFPVTGRGRAPLVWDEDAAEVVRLALVQGARGAFNVVADDPLPPEDLARLAGFRPMHLGEGASRAAISVSRALESFSGERRFDPGWLESTRIDMFPSSSRARAELGWKPRYPTNADVAIAFGKNARSGMNEHVRAALSRLKRDPARFAPGLPARDSLSVHWDLTGRDGADIDLRVTPGALSVALGIPRPPDSVVTSSTSTFVDVVTGAATVDAVLAEGRIDVRGDPLGCDAVSHILRTLALGSRRSRIVTGVTKRISDWLRKDDAHD